MGNSFNLEKGKEIVTFYENKMKEVAEKVSRFIENDFAAIQRKVKYGPVNEIGKEIIDFYNEDVKTSVIDAFGDWVDGGDSILDHTRDLAAGEDAEQHAQEMQNDLREAIDSMFPVITLENVSTYDTDISEEDFNDLKEITNRFAKDINDILSEAENTIKNNTDDNAAWAGLKAPVAGTIQRVAAAFEKIAAAFDGTKGDFTDRQNERKEKAEEAAKKAKEKAQSTADDVFAGIKNSFNIDP